MSAAFRDQTLRAVLMVAGALVAPVGSEGTEELLVIGLRHERIALYDCADKRKQGEFAKKDFRAPWRIMSEREAIRPSGRIQVLIGDKEHCVDTRSVQTNAEGVGKGLVDPAERGGAASGGVRQ